MRGMSDEIKEPVSRRQMSEDDFYALADEDSNYEYLGGELVVREPASDRHEDLFGFLNALLRLFLDERGGGLVRGSRYPMRLDPQWSPEPDLMVVREPRRRLIGPQRLEGPADLVIEIASGKYPGAALRRKLKRYREAKVPEIWVVDRFARLLRVAILEGEGYRAVVESSGRLSSAAVPGFWIDVSWLWQEPLPPTLACLRRILA
jgi:Uma2 family endonuclease